jgi:hypothetical protein
VGQTQFLVQLQQRAAGEAETLTKVELLAARVVVVERLAQWVLLTQGVQVRQDKALLVVMEST